MSAIIEVNDAGELVLSPEMLGYAKPHTRFEVTSEVDKVVLSPTQSAHSFWTNIDRKEWLKQFEDWSNQHRPSAPPLSSEALRRENIYD